MYVRAAIAIVVLSWWDVRECIVSRMELDGRVEELWRLRAHLEDVGVDDWVERRSKKTER